MSHTLYCASSSEPQANAILTDLRSSGFGQEISVFLQDKKDTKDISLKENAVRGAELGGVLGGLASLAVPGIGPALAIGPVLAALNGAAAGSVIGGLLGGTGALRPLGLPPDAVERLHHRIREGNILIGVQSEDPIELAKALTIFKSHDAKDIFDSKQKAA